jgi:glycosyltransferase involved in cell wall biosynthesis
VPTVCTVYDLQFHAHPEFFTPEDAELRARAFREACAHATRLAAISEFSRAQTMDYAHVDPARIRAIPLRLALRVAAGTQADIVERLDLMPGGYLLYPANFWKHKNHERLLEAFARAKDDPALNGRRLVLTGAPGERRDAVEATAVRLGLRDRVVFPGFVTDAELAALMQGARALVFPSLYEGFGLPVLEAMACGVPVACSDGTALHEVAQGAALLFAPADVDAIARALVAIAGDEGLRAQLVASGTQRAGEYSDADAMARQYWHLFREAMPA